MQQIDDNAMNLMICRKFCGTCPTLKKHKLNAYPPNALFCTRGKSAIAGSVVRGECNCFECDIFRQNRMNFGYYCIQSGLKK
jgi:hypothetical protein